MVEPAPKSERKAEDPESAAKLALLEARTVLPGVQTLFGFQLAVVFTSHFQSKTSFSDQCVHVAALALVAGVIALLIAPAAYHRQVEPNHVSRRFSVLITRCLRAALVLLAFAIACTVYLVVDTVFDRWRASLVAGVLTLLLFGTAWFAIPWRARLRRESGKRVQKQLGV